MTDNTSSVLSMDPRALLHQDRELAEKSFNRLKLDEQVRIVLSANADERAALIELAYNGKELVAALPPQEVWFTIQIMGGPDSLALFNQTSTEQFQFILDLECWGKDRWRPEETFEWMRLVAACGLPKIEQFFKELDIQFLGLMMKSWVTVYLRMGDEDIMDAIPWPREESPVTVDGQYYYQINDERYDQWLRPMIDSYGKMDHEGLISLFRQMFGVSLSEQEEIAFEVRQRRMEEEGFPLLDEAIGVYHRFREGEFDRLPKRSENERPKSPVTQFALIPVEGLENLFARAMRELHDPRLREQIGFELTRVANRVLIADGHEVTLAMTRVALRKAISFVNIGLERASGGDIATAVNVLQDRWLAHIFQFGFSAVMSVAEVARKWISEHPTFEAPEDPTEDLAIAHERVRAGSWKWPKFYVGPHHESGDLHRDFGTTEELELVKRAIDVL